MTPKTKAALINLSKPDAMAVIYGSIINSVTRHFIAEIDGRTIGALIDRKLVDPVNGERMSFCLNQAGREAAAKLING